MRQPLFFLEPHLHVPNTGNNAEVVAAPVAEFRCGAVAGITMSL